MHQARNAKKKKYSFHKWEEQYPDAHLQIFTMSTYGVLDSETLRDISNTWLPMLKDKGACFIRTLQVDLWFTAAKSLGMVLRTSKVS